MTTEYEPIHVVQPPEYIGKSKTVGTVVIDLYCKSCGDTCYTKGKANDKILCLKSDAIYPVWRDIKLLEEDKKARAKSEKLRSRSLTETCRICGKPYMKYGNTVCCEHCHNATKKAPLRFRTDRTTVILVDEHRKAIDIVVSVYTEMAMVGLRLKAKERGVPFRYILFMGAEVEMEDMGV